jgi:outer membrane protein OmpA-like peptidoglycan-associated protein
LIRKTLVSLILIALGYATPASAQLEWLRLTLSAGAGFASFDSTLRTDDGIPLEARVGVSIFKYVGIEGTYGKVLANSDLDTTRDLPVDHYAGSLVLNILPEHQINPYVLGGWGELRFDTPDHHINLNGWEYGGGVKIALARKQGARIDLRLEGRDVVVTNDAAGDRLPRPLSKAGENTHNLFITGGIHLELFGGMKDSDRDGVGNGSDRCPGTPYGAIVDGHGCPKDTDGDGVYDGIDLCPETPMGATVDTQGCPLDSDGDGVLNGIDQCEGTPEGAVVDAAGCPVDSDGDGVPDGLDTCANTPAGVGVDDNGCPKDSDHDGVFDGLDKCEGTPEGVKVDEQGCPIPINEMEQSLVDTGVIQLQNIYFETGRSVLRPVSHQVLHDVAAVLVKWPSLKIEIGGHADSVGTAESNLILSRNRAHAVLDYLIDNFPELKFEQFFVRGYGEEQPIASNATPEGRAKNRRVEFKVLNREALPKKK